MQCQRYEFLTNHLCTKEFSQLILFSKNSLIKALELFFILYAFHFQDIFKLSKHYWEGHYTLFNWVNPLELARAEDWLLANAVGISVKFIWLVRCGEIRLLGFDSGCLSVSLIVKVLTITDDMFYFSKINVHFNICLTHHCFNLWLCMLYCIFHLYCDFTKHVLFFCSICW